MNNINSTDLQLGATKAVIKSVVPDRGVIHRLD